MNLFDEIKQTYINAIYNDEAPNSFVSKIMALIGEDEKKLTRTQRQNRSRWKYLNMVASILNDRGDTFEAKGLDIPVRYTKDLLYDVYWQTSRGVLFPGKNRQLNTAEFCKLADHVVDLFAMVFDIHIPFPNMRDYLNQKEYEEQKKRG